MNSNSSLRFAILILLVLTSFPYNSSFAAGKKGKKGKLLIVTVDSNGNSLANISFGPCMSLTTLLSIVQRSIMEGSLS